MNLPNGNYSKYAIPLYKTWVIITGSATTKWSLGNCVICHFIIYFEREVLLVQVFARTQT